MLLAVGIVGATILPHVIFLHSALTQKRVVVREPRLLLRLYRFELVDVALAMALAGLVNAAMVITAGATLHVAGQVHVNTIEEADRALEPLLGPAAHVIFGRITTLAASACSAAIIALDVLLPCQTLGFAIIQAQAVQRVQARSTSDQASVPGPVSHRRAAARCRAGNGDRPRGRNCPWIWPLFRYLALNPKLATTPLRAIVPPPVAKPSDGSKMLSTPSAVAVSLQPDSSTSDLRTSSGQRARQ